jgi:hypothetical protein
MSIIYRLSLLSHVLDVDSAADGERCLPVGVYWSPWPISGARVLILSPIVESVPRHEDGAHRDDLGSKRPMIEHHKPRTRNELFQRYSVVHFQLGRQEECNIQWYRGTKTALSFRRHGIH